MSLPALEWLAVALAAPLLTFPTLRPRWTAGALALLVAVWLLRWAVRREPWPITPFNAPLLLFALMIPVGIWASAFPDLTLPKATGLILGLAVFRAVAFGVGARRDLGVAGATFCLLGLAITAAGALSVRWSAKVAGLGAVADRIPQLIEGLPNMPAAGVNPNQLAGAVTLYLPVAAALTIWAWGRRGLGRWLAGLVSLGYLGLMAGVLVLTQSRSGWIGGIVGLWTLTLLAGATSRARWKRFAGMGVALLLLAAVLVPLLAVGPGPVGELLDGGGSVPAVGDVVGTLSMAGRVEIWSRALYAIQDFPFTGCGLGTFRQVVHILYPLFRIGPATDIAHAHNIFLQTAVDLGLPGLVAYAALLLVALALSWRVATEGAGLTRALALGLAAGLVGLHIYGLTDALALGSKPGVAFWFALGLIAALEGGGAERRVGS